MVWATFANYSKAFIRVMYEAAVFTICNELDFGFKDDILISIQVTMLKSLSYISESGQVCLEKRSVDSCVVLRSPDDHV